LEIIDPLGDATDPINWRASTSVGGSPGAAAASLVGDYDNNATVDDADRMIWRANFGLAVPSGTSADGNGDGMVDTADYVVWRRAFMSSGMATLAAMSVVVTTPEEKSSEALGGESPGTVTATALFPGPHPVSTARRTASAEFPTTSLAAGPALLLVELEEQTVDEAIGDDNLELLDSATAGSPAHDASLDDSLAESLDIWDDEAWLGSLATLG
jgi:hypothetical protein